MEARSNPGALSAMRLSEYQRMLGDTLRMNPRLNGAWITAELSDVRVSGGHCYMELVEKDDTGGQTLAKMRANIWNNTFLALRGRFLAATGRDIQTGLKVMVRGSVTHHPVYGISFNITDINPTYTLGDLERLRREILERLQREGIIRCNRDLAFPATPQRVAVISASGAAGYGDFIDHLMNSPEGFRFYPLLVPAVMQGERTPASVCAALDFVEQSVDFWDCVVIIRGGGATTDLNAFDNYTLAQRVATFPIPVVVGIGHERDRTVLDEIACVRCKTPTAVADFLVDRVRKADAIVTDLAGRIVRYTSERLNGENMRVANFENLLPAKISACVAKGERLLDETAHSIERICSRRLMAEDSRTDRIRLRMESALRNVTERPRMRLKNLEDMLRLLSPENTLKRGYSITRVNGKAIYDPSTLKPGDEILTRLYRGEIRSSVK